VNPVCLGIKILAETTTRNKARNLRFPKNNGIFKFSNVKESRFGPSQSDDMFLELHPNRGVS
jgi:hypothetical protein